jgi:hypothetical protein
MSKFNNLSTAISYKERCIEPSKWTIVLGDDELFWLVTNKEASTLIKFGYEIAVY